MFPLFMFIFIYIQICVYIVCIYINYKYIHFFNVHRWYTLFTKQKMTLIAEIARHSGSNDTVAYCWGPGHKRGEKGRLQHLWYSQMKRCIPHHSNWKFTLNFGILMESYQTPDLLTQTFVSSLVNSPAESIGESN